MSLPRLQRHATSVGRARQNKAQVRIVLDTNIVVSGLLWRGTPYRLLDIIRLRSGVQLYSSVVLLEELADVLTRPWATGRLALVGQAPRAVLADYVDSVELVQPTAVPRVVPGDADDDHVIAAGLAARADLIVSGDRKHLLSLGSHAGIPIVAATDAIARIEAIVDMTDR